jgi:hypothetical protein
MQIYPRSHYVRIAKNAAVGMSSGMTGRTGRPTPSLLAFERVRTKQETERTAVGRRFDEDAA